MGRLKDSVDKRKLYNKKTELESRFQEKYKVEKKQYKNKVSKDLKAEISYTISYPKDLKCFDKIDEYSFVNASLPKDDKELDIYKRVLNVVNYRINTDYADIMFERDDTYRGNIFYILDYIKDIKEIDKDTLDKIFTILMHSNNLTKVEIMLDVLQSSKKYKNKDILNGLVNIVYYGTYDNLLKIVSLLVCNIAYCSETIFNDLLFKVVDNKKLNDDQIDNLYKLIRILEDNYNYSTLIYNEELANMIFDTILYVQDKNKLEYINKLLSNYEYLSFDKVDRKTKIYDMCINTFDSNIDRNKEILCLIDSVLCKDIDDKIFDYIITKIYELNNAKSLSILNTIYPIISEYSNVENSINTINSIEKDGVISKKLVINIDKE